MSSQESHQSQSQLASRTPDSTTASTTTLTHNNNENNLMMIESEATATATATATTTTTTTAGNNSSISPVFLTQELYQYIRDHGGLEVVWQAQQQRNNIPTSIASSSSSSSATTAAAAAASVVVPSSSLVFESHHHPQLSSSSSFISNGADTHDKSSQQHNNISPDHVMIQLKQGMQELGLETMEKLWKDVLQQQQQQQQQQQKEEEEENSNNNKKKKKRKLSSKQNNNNKNNIIPNETSILLSQWISKHLLIQNQLEFIQNYGLMAWRAQRQRGLKSHLSQEEHHFTQEHGLEAWKHLLKVAEGIWKDQQQYSLVQLQFQYIQEYGVGGLKHTVGAAKEMPKEDQRHQLIRQQYQYIQEYGLAALEDTVELAEEMQKEEQHRVFQELLAKKDVWMGKIMAYVGPGHFRMVAGVSKGFQELYFGYCKKVFTPKTIVDLWLPKTQAIPLHHTYYSSAFSSLGCATIWDNETKGKWCRLPDDQVCDKIAEFGNLDVLLWAHEHKKYPLIPHQHAQGSKILSLAAKGGNVDMLIWLRDKKGFAWDKHTVNSAALEGHFSAANYLLNNDCPVDAQLLAKEAAKKGSVDALKWSLDLGATWTDRVSYSAVHGGSINVLKWALKNGHNRWVHHPMILGSGEEPIAAVAARLYKYETLKWLIEDANCEVNDVRICNNVAEDGWPPKKCIELLKLLREKGCPWDEGACSHAVKDYLFGRKKLEYLRQNGCPWDEKTKQAAMDKFNYQDNYDW